MFRRGSAGHLPLGIVPALKLNVDYRLARPDLSFMMAAVLAAIRGLSVLQMTLSDLFCDL